MSKGREIFQHVCDADDEEQAVKDLREHDLCDLTVYLSNLEPKTSSVRARVLGLGICEGWQRFLKAHGKGGRK